MTSAHSVRTDSTDMRWGLNSHLNPHPPPQQIPTPGATPPNPLAPYPTSPQGIQSRGEHVGGSPALKPWGLLSGGVSPSAIKADF